MSITPDPKGIGVSATIENMNKTLDNFLSENYPRIFEERSLTVYQSCMGRGFECGNGWFPLIDLLCFNIQTYIDNHNKYCPNDARIPQVVFRQVKQKFGGLRIYHRGGDEYCNGLIHMANAISYSFCEICGIGGCLHVGHTSGVIQSVCKECSKKTKRTIKMDTEIQKMLSEAIEQDNKCLMEFYDSR